MVNFFKKLPKEKKSQKISKNKALTKDTQKFDSYEGAYYQLVFEISKKVISAIDLILDEDSHLKDVYISGGFNKNEIFVKFISLLKSDVSIRIPKVKNESALGAALLMKEYF